MRLRNNNYPNVLGVCIRLQCHSVRFVQF